MLPLRSSCASGITICASGMLGVLQRVCPVRKQAQAFADYHNTTHCCSNNSSLDLFGLYREVVKQGGLISNESYDERGRWNGGINFAGEHSSTLYTQHCHLVNTSLQDVARVCLASM